MEEKVSRETGWAGVERWEKGELGVWLWPHTLGGGLIMTFAGSAPPAWQEGPGAWASESYLKGVSLG